jgi:CheY-like chemotaxis protein
MANILVIDDTQAIADIVEHLLNKEGHTVVKANDGQDAIDLLKKDTGFDLVITDMLMPAKDGFDVISFLKSDFPEMKIIAMTGGGATLTPGTLLRSVGNDINSFLTKPIGKMELLKAVNEVLT